MRLRRGTALLEVMVLIASCSVVLTLSTATIHRMLTMSQRMNHAANLQRLTQQVSSQLHTDIRDSTSAQIATSESTAHSWSMTLTRLQETITYTAEGNKLMRVVTYTQGDLPSRNAFIFPETIFFGIRKTSTTLARIDIDICRRLDTSGASAWEDHARERSAEPPLVLCRIADVVGYDHRYGTPTTLENSP